MSEKRRCPALFISASASNQGKTTITAGLAHYHRKQGRNVHVFKVGPDFLDPMILEQASGNPVFNLDLWMVGEEECRRLLYATAETADIILVEGVMGLFDGKPSSADLAETFNIPILAIINAGSMAQTFQAIAHGLTTFRPSLSFAGVMANGIASNRHATMLIEGAPSTIHYCGGIFRNQAITLPNRHLGLIQASEIADLDERLSAAACAVHTAGITQLLPEVEFLPATPCTIPHLLEGVRIAIAHDAAFSFLYPANLILLEEMGAQLSYFSPLKDNYFPEADSLYFPGGYPELYLDRLQNNIEMKQAIRTHFEADKPIYAECGGMLYLLESLTDKDGNTGEMVGLIQGKAILQNRLSALGYQYLKHPEGDLRGHTFHHSLSQIPLIPSSHAHRQYDDSQGESIYNFRNLWASYVHLYLASNPTAAASLFMKYQSQPKQSLHKANQTDLSIGTLQ